MGILNQIQQMMGELQCEPENFTGRIIFKSMFNDIVWDTKGNDELCEDNSKLIGKYAERFLRGHWSFLGPGSEKKWGRNLLLQTRWILGPNCTENAAELRRVRSSDIPLCQRLGERRIKKQRKGKDVNTLQWQQ